MATIRVDPKFSEERIISGYGEAVQECYRRLRVLTLTEAPDTSYGSEPREVARG